MCPVKKYIFFNPFYTNDLANLATLKISPFSHKTRKFVQCMDGHFTNGHYWALQTLFSARFKTGTKTVHFGTHVR